MTAIDTARLDKLLSMLTSGFGGEQANAASMIARMAANHKLTVPELMEAAVLQKNGPKPDPPQQKKSSAYDFNRDVDQGNVVLAKLRVIATECPQILTEWEREWATDVAGRYSSDDQLSSKQLAVANRILFKFEAAASREWSNI